MSSTVFISSAADFYPPPYTFETATSVTFFVEPNDKQKLHDICDKFLNDPLGKPGRFKLNLERVLLTFSSFPEVESEPNPAIGYLSYQEVSFIILVRDTAKQQVGMFAPILFLDGPQTGNAEYFASWPIALGREVFGLAKTRGEIDFQLSDFTGYLRSPYPSALNAPLELPVIVKVSLPVQAKKTEIVFELKNLEEKLLLRPGDERLLKKKTNLLERLGTAKKELRRVRRTPMVGPPYHPFELVERVWGASIADERLKMKDQVREVPPEIRDALQKVQRGAFNPAELENAMKIAIDIGFFNALNIHVMQNSPWTAGLGYGLHGLRQLHAPGDFPSADHRDVIRSPFEYMTPSQPAQNQYLIEFLEPKLATSLGLAPSYDVLGSNTVVHLNGFATYGVPSKTDRVT